MTGGVPVFDVPWQQEEKRRTVTVAIEPTVWRGPSRRGAETAERAKENGECFGS